MKEKNVRWKIFIWNNCEIKIVKYGNIKKFILLENFIFVSECQRFQSFFYFLFLIVAVYPRIVI